MPLKSVWLVWMHFDEICFKQTALICISNISCYSVTRMRAESTGMEAPPSPSLGRFTVRGGHETSRGAMRWEEEKRVNRARLARIGEAAGRDVRDSGVRALLIHTQQSQTETHTHTLRASPLYHQQPSATASARPTAARRQKRRREDLASRFGFCPLFVHFIWAGSRAIMMSMNSKQPHFAMHPSLPEHKYTTLHSSSEAIRRACLQTPQVNELQTSAFLPRSPLRARRSAGGAYTALMFFSCIPQQSSARLWSFLKACSLKAQASAFFVLIFMTGSLLKGIFSVLCVDTIPQLTSPLSFCFSVFLALSPTPATKQHLRQSGWDAAGPRRSSGGRGHRRVPG